ncbi:PAS domain-containing protein [Oceanimonas baumannii]|uniref:PAS domain-containing sensor histidine kinase n=1 Tax=Oceanimonas baumannii TaxID=129578 RepID=UPI001D1826C0|nr:PAS domain-containing sensor histidine kinase [Oceanimonas baumannii]MCC4264651.1 PAS domain-containing protein [Oceanimonas baumannii]
MFNHFLKIKKNSTHGLEQSQEATHPGIVFTFDEKGEIVNRQGQLNLQVSDNLFSLANILGLPEHDIRPAAWTGKVIEISLTDTQGNLLDFHGVIEQEADLWKLKLINITRLVTEKYKKDKTVFRGKYIEKSIETILNIDSGDLDTAISNSLAQLSQLYLLSSVSLIMRDENNFWSVSHSQGSSLELNMFVEESAHEIVNDAHKPELIEQTLYSGNKYSLLIIPYHYNYKIEAFIIVGMDKKSDTDTEDIRVKCKLLAGAALARIRDQEHSNREVISQYIATEKSIYWIEYDINQSAFIIPEPMSELLSVDTVCSHQDFIEKVAEAEREEFNDRMLSAVSRLGNIKQNIRLQHADKQYFWYEINLSLERAGKEENMLCGSITQVDHIVKAELEARAAQERITTLVANAPAIIYLQKYVHGALRSHYFSDSIQSLLGWSAEEFKETSLPEHVHPEDKDIFHNRTATLLKYGIVSCHYRLLDTKGQYHWMLDEAKLIRDQWGQPQEVIGLYIDVTESVHANEKLNASEERYRILVEDSPAIICRYSKNLLITFANKLFLDYVSSDNESIIDLNNFLSDEQREAFHSRLQKLSPEHPIINAEICLHVPNRKPLWVVWAERGIFDDQGNLQEVQAVGRDNTEVYKARLEMYQSAKMAMLGELSTTLAHEINQPLCVMRMSINNLKRKMKSAEPDIDYMMKKLDRIDEQIERSTRTIEHLRFFGRRSALEKKLFTPQNAIDGALSLTKDTLQNHHIKLHILTSPTPQVLGHQDQLEQVLINLLINAKDALLEKQEIQADFCPEIYINMLHNGNLVNITIEDNGSGIPPEHLDSIFDSFFTTKPHGKGTGIGLNVSLGIIEKMYGRLTAHNSEKGAVFSIELPVHKNSNTNVIQLT